MCGTWWVLLSLFDMNWTLISLGDLRIKIFITRKNYSICITYERKEMEGLQIDWCSGNWLICFNFTETNWCGLLLWRMAIIYIYIYIRYDRHFVISITFGIYVPKCFICAFLVKAILELNSTLVHHFHAYLFLFQHKDLQIYLFS